VKHCTSSPLSTSRQGSEFASPSATSISNHIVRPSTYPGLLRTQLHVPHPPRLTIRIPIPIICEIVTAKTQLLYQWVLKSDVSRTCNGMTLLQSCTTNAVVTIVKWRVNHPIVQVVNTCKCQHGQVILVSSRQNAERSAWARLGNSHLAVTTISPIVPDVVSVRWCGRADVPHLLVAWRDQSHVQPVILEHLHQYSGTHCGGLQSPSESQVNHG
jgi:hypothetical protein